MARAISRLDTDGKVDASLFYGAIARDAQSLIVQADGRLLTGRSGSNDDTPIARYFADGSLDRPFTFEATSFFQATRAPCGGGGVSATVNFALQADQKVVITGVTHGATVSNNAAVSMMRLNPDGTPDQTFGGTGCVVFGDLFTYDLGEYPSAIAVQASGKLIVAANKRLGNSDETASLMRVNADGTLDTSFGNGGRVPLGQTAGRSSIVATLAQQPGGAIVMVVYGFDTATGGASTRSLLRFSQDGIPDPTFGAGGAVALDTNTGAGGPLLVQPDGKILVTVGRGQQAQVRRYSKEGLLDTSFGDAGAINPQLRVVNSMLIGTDGSLYLAGETLAPAPATLIGQVVGNAAVVRYVGGPTALIEFYNPALDHYFNSANPLEIDVIDAGRFAGWVRTGKTFGVFGSSAAAPANFLPTCRFYIPPGKGDSHFFSVSATECATVAQHVLSDPNYAGYIEETAAAFFVALPDGSTGTCPIDTVPVFRLWNQRADSNHRYTTDPALRDLMIARGYVAEGYGPLGVAMCAVRPD